MSTVAQEMPAEERRTRLLHGLNSTGQEEVVVNFSHLAHAIGMDAAEVLVLKLVAMDGLVSTPYSRKPRLETSGMSLINRLAAIAAIERAQARTTKLQIDQMIKRRSREG